jgi:cytochrome c-type biogenesis protein CcmH/NrfG
MLERIAEAERLFKEYKIEEAGELLQMTLIDEPDNKKALLLLGKIHSRTQNFGEAMNCFNQVLNSEPQNSEALTGLQLIKNILQLTNNYYFENAYTDDDLYEFNT